jgi:hypothetical protein
VASEDYHPPFKFTGKLAKLTLTIERPKLTPEDEKKLMEGTGIRRQLNNKPARSDNFSIEKCGPHSWDAARDFY